MSSLDQPPKAHEIPDTLSPYRDDEKELARSVQEKHAAGTPERGNHRRRNIAGAVIGVLAIAGIGGGLASRGGDKAPAPRLPEASASATPGQSPSAKETSTASVEQDKYRNVSLENVTGLPTEEQIEAAKVKVVSLKDYPTASDAIAEFGNIFNVYSKSGKFTTDSNNTPAITEASAADGQAILENVYGDNLTPEIAQGYATFRYDWSLAATPEPGMPGAGVELLLENVPDPTTEKVNPDGTYYVEYDEMRQDSNPNNANRGADFHSKAILENDGSAWHLVEEHPIEQIG